MGRALERCRFHFLSRLSDRSHALVFGDGDGRFLAALLKQNPALDADAVDTSAVMLSLLRTRCKAASVGTDSRLNIHETDALSFLSSPPQKTFDLVVTHFFFDCLTQPEIELIAARTAPLLLPEAIWLISEFRIPDGLARLPAKFMVRSLYLAFRVLTGLRTTHLPDHSSALIKSGFTCISRFHPLFGILTTELWTLCTPSK